MFALLVSSSPESRRFLGGLLWKLGWRTVQSDGLSALAGLLHTRRFTVVICEADLPDGRWTDVLDALAGPASPALIVTSRLADERLWADVLHRGGYDVLAQPFDKGEVERVMELARHPDRAGRRQESAGNGSAAA